MEPIRYSLGLARIVHEACGRKGYWTRLNADKRRQDMVICPRAEQQELRLRSSPSKNASPSRIHE
jgi:hypothetical protein